MSFSQDQIIIHGVAMSKVRRSYEGLANLEPRNPLLKHIIYMGDVFVFKDHDYFLKEYAINEEDSFKRVVLALDNYASRLDEEINKIEIRTTIFF